MTYKPDQLLISETTESLFLDVASSICDIANICVRKNGIFNLALAGGSTPEKLYSTLSSASYIDKMPWQFSHFYFGDERMVTHDHADSNYLMAKRTLFDRAPIPAQNIHPVPTDCIDAKTCAEQYAASVSHVDSFDMILLGMGDDGHTASLFPQTGILDEKIKKVAAVYVEKMNSWRISMTYQVLNDAQRVLVLIQGEKKQAIVKNVLYGDNSTQYPITAVRPAGKLIWHMDRAAHPADLKKPPSL